MRINPRAPMLYWVGIETAYKYFDGSSDTLHAIVGYLSENRYDMIVTTHEEPPLEQAIDISLNDTTEDEVSDYILKGVREELLDKDNKLIAENLKVGYKGLVEFYNTNPSILRTLEENPLVFWREFQKFVIDDLYYLITDITLPNYVKAKWLIFNCESFGLEVPADTIREVHNIENTEDDVTDLEDNDGAIDRLYVLLENKLVAYIRNL